jgi:hypothetical protein
LISHELLYIGAEGLGIRAVKTKRRVAAVSCLNACLDRRNTYAFSRVWHLNDYLFNVFRLDDVLFPAVTSAAAKETSDEDNALA